MSKRGGAVVGLTTGVHVSGCLDRGFDVAGETESIAGDPKSVTNTTGRTVRPLEVVHWWTALGEVQAIDALLDGFGTLEPSIEVTSVPIAGGAGDRLRRSIAERLVDGRPPGTFQCWGGPGLDPYVESESLYPIDDAWMAEASPAFHTDALHAVSRRSELYAIPLSIPRTNLLFYDVSIVERVGLDPRRLATPVELVEAVTTVGEATGGAGMSIHHAGWSILQLFAQVLLGQSGLAAYAAVLKGDPVGYVDEIERAFEVVLALRDVAAGPTSSWDRASGRMTGEGVAFVPGGDWIAGLLRATGSMEGEEWNAVPMPGTSRWYVLTVDAFVNPRNNPSPDETDAFLEYVGSIDAQRRFNREKCSVPARRDVSMDGFDSFSRRQLEAYDGADARLPSIAHGMGLEESRRRRAVAVCDGLDGNASARTVANTFVDTVSI